MGPFAVTGPKAKDYPAEDKFYIIELVRQGDQWIMDGYALSD